VERILRVASESYYRVPSLQQIVHFTSYIELESDRMLLRDQGLLHNYIRLRAFSSLTLLLFEVPVYENLNNLSR
jgi:hypothetical protein